jgi:predicted nucleotide-binding protein (sugar kinase/HSP70/actin superfamily)
MKIGIPRTFFFYYYYPFWSVFFQTLGFEIILSPPTDSTILADGIWRTLDEYCLPVKIHRGHIAWLTEKCTAIFSPGYGRKGDQGFFCPKLMGLPDVIRSAHPAAVTFWHDFDADDHLNEEQWRATVRQIDPDLTRKTFTKAWTAAMAAEEQFLLNLRAGVPLMVEIAQWTGEQTDWANNNPNPRYRLALLGHPYLVYDPWICGRLMETLRKYQAELCFQENIPINAIGQRWPFQQKRIYWPVGQETLSAAYYYRQATTIDGIIQISSCLCGPDAIVGELLEKYIHRHGEKPIPLLQLTIDEHSGWAGLQTRIEAFLDLLDWRRNYASL